MKKESLVEIVLKTGMQMSVACTVPYNDFKIMTENIQEAKGFVRIPTLNQLGEESLILVNLDSVAMLTCGPHSEPRIIAPNRNIQSS